MKLSTYLVFFIFVLPRANASFKELAQKYVSSSSEAELSSLDAQLSLLNSEQIAAQNNWYLMGSLNYKNGAAPSLFSFQSQKTTNYIGNYELFKKFSWGGRFSFSQGLNLQDISQWNMNTGFPLPSSSTKYYTFQNKIGYEQDLLSDFGGRNFKLSLKEGALGTEIADLNKKQIGNKKLFELFQLYNQAKLLLNLHELNEKNYANAKQRNSVVRARYRDGISSLSEKLQAQQSLDLAQNSISESEQSIELILNQLQSFLGENVERSVISKRVNPSISVSAIKDMGNIDLELLEKSLELSKLSSQRVSNSSGLGMKLKLGYSRSAISDSLSESLKDSFSESEFDNKEASLNFSYAFGKDVSRVEELKKKIEVKKNATRLEQLKAQVEREKGFLQKSILRNQKQVQSLKSMQKLSTRIVREQDRLYRKGKIEIENVLSAQSESLNVGRRYLEKLARLQLDTANFYQLNGQFSKFVERYHE